MPPFDSERDLQILEGMADQVRTYLIEDELFWPIPGRLRGGMPRLTLGGYLLRRHRLTALRGSLSADQQARLDAALAVFDAALSEWSVHATRKMLREWDVRINLLTQFLKDCEREDASSCLDGWPNQAKVRTIVHHLAGALEAAGALETSHKADVRRIDNGLRRFLLSGDDQQFLWSPDLAPVYPRDAYWWLWVVPQGTDELK